MNKPKSKPKTALENDPTSAKPAQPTGLLPLFHFRGESYYRVQGVEKYVIGSRHLFFANNNVAHKQFGPVGLQLEGGDWFATGTLRNSIYIEPWAQLSSLRDLSILVDFEGALKFKVMCAGKGREPEVVTEVKLVSATRAKQLIQLGSPTDLPENCRIFWHVDVLPGGCTLFDVNYCSRTVPAPKRLAVLLRTFGRTTDVKALLRRFANAGLQDSFYASVLDQMDFWVLDTTAGAESEYTDEWVDSLNLKVLVGPNLGGGGNAGHMLKLFDDHCRQSASPPDELLILDDDLSLSMESLVRYYTFTTYRVQEVICSLPIMMKSRPLTVWEDGGFWGRLNFAQHSNFGLQRTLFPNLLKHGTQLSGYDHLDDFGPLNTCEYSTFIFFGLSMKSFRKIGYPASFFLRGDDIELSLRAGAAGLQMITNPNLAAWHEPAHSYGQEYMAILHGIIINLTYSESDATYYTRFFEERLYEHASLDDLIGMRLYKDILAELLDPKSLVLTPEFQHHYLPKLKELGSVKFMKIPENERPLYEQRGAQANTLLVPFVYPGYQKDTHKAKSVVVINHSAKAYRELPPVDQAAKSVLTSEYAALVAMLSSKFEAVKKQWQSRLKTTSQEAYWADIQARYKGETREIYATQRNVAALFARLTEAVSGKQAAIMSDAVVREGGRPRQVTVSQQAVLKANAPEPETTAQSIQRQSVKASQVPVNPTVKHSSVGLKTLPADFDPEYYLVINADVKEAGLDPVEHFLKYGQAEGRIYKA